MEPQNKEPIITQQCRNFRDYLEREFELKGFGNFVGAATFSLDKVYRLLEETRDGKPAFMRLYYGCEPSGENHTLFMAVLNENGEVISTQTLDEDPVKMEYRCPPGGNCGSDRNLKDVM